MTPTGLPARALLVVAVSIALACASPPTEAQPSPQGTTVALAFDIPAQSLSATLTQIARQGGRSLSLDPQLVEGLRAPPIRGQYSVEDALRSALADTSLDVVVLANGGLTLRRRPASGEQRQPAPQSQRAPAGQEPTYLDDAQVTRLSTVNVHGTRGDTAYDVNMDLARSVNDPQAYYIFDAAVLRQSAAVNVEDFLRTRLTMNDSGISFGQQATAAEGVASQLNLRGMGPSKTLILVNGRRMAGSNQHGLLQNQTNLNSIPITAIERIEVLPSSASGIYGGGAMGGVINVILKKDFSTREVNFSYENPQRTDAAITKGSFSIGETFEDGRTRMLLSGQRSYSNSLRVIDRKDVFDEYRDRILSNNPSFLMSTVSPYPGSTPNIGSLSGADLVLRDGRSLGSAMTHVSPGTLPDIASDLLADMLLANAGGYNLEDERTPNRLLSIYEKDAMEESMALSLRRRFTDRIEGYADLYYDSSRSSESPNVSGPLYLSAASPYNPFTEMVAIHIPRYIPDISHDVYLKNRSIVTGVSMELPKNWTLASEFIYSESIWNFTRYQPDTGYLTSLIDAGLYNPFSDVLAYPQGMDQPGTVYKVMTPSNNKTRVREITVRANGDLFELPWGTMAEAAVGASFSQERRGGNSRDRVDYPAGFYSGNDYFPRHSTNFSLYAEATLPLVQQDRFRFIHALDLQLAARTERRTQDTGTQYAIIDGEDDLVGYVPGDENGLPFESSTRYSATTPTVAIKYQPSKEVIIRASYAEAFLPPSSSELALNPVPNTLPTSILDPHTNLRYPVQVLTGGNPDLTPLTSESWNAGIVYMPSRGFLEGWRLGLEYYNITQNDVIGTLSAQALVDAGDQFPDRITRDPASGLITQVNTRMLNLAKFKTRGFDAIADTIMPTENLGTFGLNLMATLIKSDARQLNFNGPYTEVSGYAGGTLRVRGNMSLSWDIGNWLVNWNSRYYHSYGIGYADGSPYAYLNPPRILAQGADRVPSQTYHDLVTHYHFPQPSGALQDVTIQVGIKNLFDKVPPMDVMANSSVWVSPYGDMMLRTYYLNLTKRF